MRKSNGEYRSRVYTDRPDYADFDAPQKFQAIESIIAKRLIEHPNAILELIGKYEPGIKKAAWNIFGESYRYRAAYNAYKARRMAEAKLHMDGQISIFDLGC